VTGGKESGSSIHCGKKDSPCWTNCYGRIFSNLLNKAVAKGVTSPWVNAAEREALFLNFSSFKSEVMLRFFPWCARHGRQLGGESPLWGVTAPTTSQKQGVYREVESDGYNLRWGHSRTGKFSLPGLPGNGRTSGVR